MSVTNPLVSEFANELPSLRAALEATVGLLPDVDVAPSQNPIGDETASVWIVTGHGTSKMHYRRSWAEDPDSSSDFLSIARAALALHLYARQAEIDRARSLVARPPTGRLLP